MIDVMGGRTDRWIDGWIDREIKDIYCGGSSLG